MNQAQWNSRIAGRGDVWQYFKMDDASGLPQDSSPGYGFCHMTSGTGAAYGVTGPFANAEAITVATMFSSPVYTSSPALNVNYGAPKTMEGWLYLNNAPSTLGVLIGAGNMAITMQPDRRLGLVRQGVAIFGSVTADPFPLGEWHFVMLTIPSTSDMLLYIDDNVVLSWSGAWPIPNASMLHLGQSGPSGTFTFSNCSFIDDAPLEPDLEALRRPQIFRTS
jgi:hypothetical protein